MVGQSGTLENLILKKLAIHHALTEGKLLDMTVDSDAKGNTTLFSMAVARLLMRGLVDIVDDPTHTMRVVRTKQKYQ